MKRIILATVLLFTIAALVWGLQMLGTSSAPEAPVVSAPARQPDAIATNTDSVSYTTEGQLAWRLQADEVQFYRNPDYSTFTQPRAIMYQQDNPEPWRARANYGSLENEDQVHLRQDVVIMTRSQDSPVHQINTEYLAIDLTQNIMRTDQPLVITGPGLRIEANGLHAELDSERITLTNGVRSTYEP